MPLIVSISTSLHAHQVRPGNCHYENPRTSAYCLQNEFKNRVTYDNFWFQNFEMLILQDTYAPTNRSTFRCLNCNSENYKTDTFSWLTDFHSITAQQLVISKFKNALLYHFYTDSYYANQNDFVTRDICHYNTDRFQIKGQVTINKNNFKKLSYLSLSETDENSICNKLNPKYNTSANRALCFELQQFCQYSSRHSPLAK